MSQKRVLDYNASVTAAAINYINKQEFTAGILLPKKDIIEILGSSVIKVNPHTILTPDGVIISNSSSENINFTLTEEEKTYTIISRHIYVNSSGGTSANIELVSSLFPVDYFSDATVLGWVSYPGSSVPLNNSMLFSPRALRVQETSNDDKPIYSETAPFNTKWIEISSSSGINVSNTFINNKAVTKIFNSNVIIQNMVCVLPIVNGEYPPSAIRITCKADFQAGLIVSVFDEYGTEYFPTNNIIANTDWGIFYMKLPNFNGLNVFKPHSTWKLRLAFQLNPTKNLYLEAIDVVDHNLPVAPNNTVVDFNYAFTFSRLSSVISRWNPVTLPVLPSIGDRYLSTATNNGWNINEIKEWNGLSWITTTPTKGNTVYVTGELVDYVYNGVVFTKEIPKHKVTV